MSDQIKKYIIRGYYPTIGIECHVQLKTKTKLFSSVSNEARDADPNSLVSHICFGLPGALPVLNGEAVRLASYAAYALGTTPQKFSKFDRKHYFYPDLPKGYQISQFDQPIILNGSITIYLDDGEEKLINITRAHLEEDAGKSTHPAGTDYSLVDLNRAGTPLLEIVSEPELHSSAEAKAYAKELWLRMKYAGVSDVDLYHGNMRFDVNVSVSKDPSTLGTRTETKNLNSFRSIERAVDYEIQRQIDAIESGNTIIQETRGWLDDVQKTVSQRSKEDAHDYRYFPDPDIPPIVLDDAFIQQIEATLPKMAYEYRNELRELGIDAGSIETLLNISTEEDNLVQVVTSCLPNMKLASFVAKYIVNTLTSGSEEGGEIKHRPSIAQYNQVFTMIDAGKLSSTNAKMLLDDIGEDEDPEKVAENRGLIQMSDSGEMEAIVSQVLNDNPKPTDDVKNGEMKAIGFLVGQVMKASGGKANPSEVLKIIRDKLGV
jgi:aspartyl-tRNA(Asn)/glutamyl-tRNA(Gln) amidotransferase subunit B